MNNRLKDVNSYDLFNTDPIKKLDDITDLASLICGTPISLVTILDDERQWFKSNKGLDINETKVEDSFCQHALHKPFEVLVVNDALEDERFINNKLVTGDPNIRFYAGAPLITKNNNVLGTLCIIDRKPRAFSDDQKRALQILSKKAMEILETQKHVNSLTTTIEITTERLVKLTENLPIGVFEMEVSTRGEMKFTFLSKGMKYLHPEINLMEWLKDPSIGFSVMHPDDIEGLKHAINDSIDKEERLYHEYRVENNSDFDWHAIAGNPVKMENGDTKIYGTFTDITHHYVYQSALEQISFDISHVLRRPVTSMLGIINLIEAEEELSSAKILEYSGYIKTIAVEFEEYTRNINKIYSDKKEKIKNHIENNKT